MSFFKNILNFIKKASLPTFKFENNQLHFKLKNDDYFIYELGEYEIKTRHDSYVLEAYTLNNNELFLEYIRPDNIASWNGDFLGFYEDFFKEKLGIKTFKKLEELEVNNYTFKVFKIDNSFVLHTIYISTVISDIIIIDMKGNLYKNLLFRLEGKYDYNFEKEDKGSVNFNISLIKENCLRGYLGANND